MSLPDVINVICTVTHNNSVLGKITVPVDIKQITDEYDSLEEVDSANVLDDIATNVLVEMEPEQEEIVDNWLAAHAQVQELQRENKPYTPLNDVEEGQFISSAEMFL